MMKISTMRVADTWLGWPLCFLLTAVRKLAGPFSRRPSGPIRKILFVKPAEQGSTVLAYPAVCKAVEMVGRENVYFLVFEENRFILDAMEVIPEQNVFAMPTRNAFTVIFGGLRQILRLRRLRIDASVDLEFFVRASAVISYLSGARSRAGLHASYGESTYRGDLMTHRVLFNPHLHTTDMFLAMVSALERDPADFPAFDVKPTPVEDLPIPVYEPSEADLRGVRDLLKDACGKEDPAPLILLNANCSDLLSLRRWPSERYVELARRLLAAYPEVRVAFTGAPEDAESGRQLVAETAHERCFSLAGKTTLRQFFTILTLAEVLVTNDSGPAHFASLTQAHVVTLFGPETPELFAARTPRSHVLWEGVACSPCVTAFNHRQSACRDNRCVKRITVDHVFDEVRAIREQAR